MSPSPPLYLPISHPANHGGAPEQGRDRIELGRGRVGAGAAASVPFLLASAGPDTPPPIRERSASPCVRRTDERPASSITGPAKVWWHRDLAPAHTSRALTSGGPMKRTLASALPEVTPGSPVQLQGWVHRRRE